MTDTTAPAHPGLTTADGTPLKVSLRKSEARARRRAFMLVLPLLAFILITFAVPISMLISRSVHNPEVADFLPKAASEIQSWDGKDLPGEAVFAALAEDMQLGLKERTLGRAAARINREIAGSRSLMMKTARKLKTFEAPYKEAFLNFDKRWSNQTLWTLMKRETRRITPAYYLLAMDLEYSPTGEIQQRHPDYQVYVDLFGRTAWMSLFITGLCILLAYPIAYLLATLPLRYANVLMILVLLPFWTSLLVRTSAWIVLLQSQGVLNDLLVWFGIVGDDERIRMIYNRMGTIISMTHILLPFMVLPLYSVMKTISPTYMRAARSLGANQFTAWMKIYFPLTLPGMAAGVMLVFILAIGYYITPALVGGETGIFISNIIAKNMQGTSAQLKLAAALATILLVGVLILYWLFNRIVGVERLKFG